MTEIRGYSWPFQGGAAGDHLPAAEEAASSADIIIAFIPTPSCSTGVHVDAASRDNGDNVTHAPTFQVNIYISHNIQKYIPIKTRPW